MAKVLLSKIKSLTFYKDSLTEARRTDAISQLSCVGAPCKLYTPDVVRCENIGGAGLDVDWKVSIKSAWSRHSDIHQA